ncbi:MAG: helicase-exonuclease AddAB subunit AddA [Lachnospiraceae bacterium]|nr:helicase-exonuclease AddAB subunit AddA [Lachnospiraceae bacterium]
MEFTNEQLQAIESRGENLLVSAAAGSGKTAVLVGRIIRRILSDDKPVDIDRLLVMTFTRAAAEQMKEKILKAIEDKRSKDPSNRNLIRQATLVHNAKISTIHGFCLDVIKNHFQEIGLDPGFRVADEGECKLLKADALERVIEKAYEEGSDDFVYMVECLSTGRSDRVLEEIILNMYEFSMSDPDPDEWLKRCLDAYDDKEDGDPEWSRILTDHAGMILADAYTSAMRASGLTGEEAGPYMYEPAAEVDIELIERLKGCKSYEDLRTGLAGADFVRLKNKPKDGPDVDEDLKEEFKALREAYKKIITDLKRDFALPEDEQEKRIRACYPVVKELVKLTERMRDEFSALKRDRKVVDFSDLEHLCIKILKGNDGATAAEYRDFFEEIYVDEYQDSNLVQEEILKCITRGNNLFMVGDVKQSIYSFRLARVQLFTQKYEEYESREGTGNRKIDLSKNFRSRQSVLACVNELFEQIMKQEFGSVRYDEAARLYYGADYPEAVKDQDRSELILVEHHDDTDDRELEAKAIAARIKALMKDQMIHDPSDEDKYRMRPIRYSDIVILLRTARGWDDTFKKVISAEGIPVHTMSQEGYFEASEVKTLLNYLNILDNPLQDICMASVLKSWFGGFSDEDLALLKVNHKDKYLYGSLRACAQGENGELGTRAAVFLERFDKIREKTGYTPVADILLELTDSGYGLYVSALPDGRKRSANVNMLIQKAENYGKTSYKGIFHFARYIRMLRDYEIDYGEANILDENDDTVRIMTIHKSKGLEFPVCFVAGCHKDYNMMDAYRSVINDIDLGLGIDLVDPKRRLKQTTAMKRAIVIKKESEILAEEERILYVAMTRAKEKLILTGIVKNPDRDLMPKGLLKCCNYLSLIVHGLNEKGIPSLTTKNITAADIIDEAVAEAVKDRARREEILAVMGKRNDAAAHEPQGRFSFRYPYENEGKAFEKVSVTELKRRSMEAADDPELPVQVHEIYPPEEIKPYIPDFIREGETTIPATLHGTAVHRVFEVWDYSRGTADRDIEEFLEYVKNEGLMEEALAGCVTISEISGFLNSPLAARMKKADEQGLLYREQPFMFSHDGIIIQGIIDAFFLEDDKIVIVDYKTDRVNDINDLADRYHVQLEYYALALKSMLDKEIGELVIYSTRYKDIVSIPTAVVN